MEASAMDDRIRHAGALLALCASLTLAIPARAGDGAAMGATPEAASHAFAGATLHSLDGRAWSLSALKGQVVVINFWASWCAPCRKELPQLATLDAELAKHGGRVVAVSIDSDPANARRFVTSRALALPVVIDGPDGLARVLDLKQVPTTVVLDRDGSVACAVAGSGEAALAKVTETARRLSTRGAVADAGSETR
jgi:thiol-disulfide isomerase/thioredoxin